jgi:isoleucyl-tRNA synthetase
MKAVAAAIAGGAPGVAGLHGQGPASVVVEGVEVTPEDVLVTRVPKAGLVVASQGRVVVGLETALTPELVAEGDAREFVSRVQAMRKAADLEVTQRIRLRVAADAAFRAALAAHVDYVKNETLALDVAVEDGTGDVELNGHRLSIAMEAV